jgi:hypothetical protein
LTSPSPGRVIATPKENPGARPGRGESGELGPPSWYIWRSIHVDIDPVYGRLVPLHPFSGTGKAPRGVRKARAPSGRRRRASPAISSFPRRTTRNPTADTTIATITADGAARQPPRKLGAEGQGCRATQQGH